MRSVLFVDPPAFCTAVEGLVAPALRSRPVAVAPPGADRATVLALSVEARLAGIERGMPVRQALKRCPDLVLLPPNPRLYARASRALHEVLRIYAPVIEPRGYGHAFLDLTGTGRLFGPAVDVAARVQREVRERLRLAVSVGVAANKLVSQAATTVIKPEPLLEVPGGDEAGFLAPHPLDVLPDLPPRLRRRLDDYQLDLIGEVAVIPESALCAVFGGAGRTLRAQARGIDPRPVLPPERQAEFHVAHALATDTNDLGVLHPLLRLLGERLGRRLRRHALVARRLRVELTYADHTAAVRAVPLHTAALDAELWDAARRAFTRANARRLAVRVVALTLDGLETAESQLDLWEVEAAGSQPAGDLSTVDWLELGTRGPAESGRSTVGLCGDQAPLVRPPGYRTSGHASTAEHPDVRGPALQDAIDRIRGRWGARGVVRGSGLALSGSGRRDAPPSWPAPAPS
jgi:DNA polymerase-4